MALQTMMKMSKFSFIFLLLGMISLIDCIGSIKSRSTGVEADQDGLLAGLEVPNIDDTSHSPPQNVNTHKHHKLTPNTKEDSKDYVPKALCTGDVTMSPSLLAKTIQLMVLHFFKGHKLTPGMQLSIPELHERGPKRNMEVFCHDPEPKGMSSFFKTVEMHLDLHTDNYKYYEAENYTAVLEKKEKETVLSLLVPWWKTNTFVLDLYRKSCIGIDTIHDFRVNMRVRWLDFWRVACFLSGIILFTTAPHLAQNVFFHYTTGMTLGICGSLMIIFFVLARMVPKKTGAVTVMMGGWGLSLFILQYLWQNLKEVMMEYQTVVLGYLIVAGLVSFAVVYRWGPLTNPRSINLVQWSMQMVALLAIFFSSQFREATLGTIIALLMYYNVPLVWKARVRTMWRRRFPPKVRLLTEAEFLQQGTVETRKALEDLRTFCRSPECNSWKTVSRLRTPQRFAEFIEGNSHLTDHEILAYESDQYESKNNLEDDLLYTSDEDSDN